MKIFESLATHRNLAKGWYMGKGGPLSEDVIEIAKDLCSRLLANDVDPNDLEDFPFSDGRLELAYYTPDENVFQFLIDTNGEIRVAYICEERKLTLGDRLSPAKAVSVAFFYETWRLFDTSTSEISAKNEMDISGGRALNPLRMENGQWSMPIVLNLSGETPALMEKNFISTKPYRKARQAIQSYLRRSTSPNFRAQAYSYPLKRTKIPATTTLMGLIQRNSPLSEPNLRDLAWAGSGYAMGIGQLQLLTNNYVASGQHSTAELANINYGASVPSSLELALAHKE